MFGLDDWLASRFSDGRRVGLLIVALVAVLLGLRHATDPDHLAAVTTLVAAGERAARRAARLGLAWGAGHALTLFAFGLPIVLFDAYLPERLQQGAETVVGGRDRRPRGVGCSSAGGAALPRSTSTSTTARTHVHGRRPRARARAPHALGRSDRPPVHGMGGSAGVGVLLVASIESTAAARSRSACSPPSRPCR